MTVPFLGEIQMYGFNFNPRGWAFCNGATLPIQQNTALFALLGTQYGGNGQTTFQLPNFSSRAGCQYGTGAGLTPRTIGEPFGTSTVSLSQSEMPSHTHAMVLYAQNNPAKRAATPSSGAALSVSSSASATSFLPSGSPATTFAPNFIQPFSGGGQPHANEQPYLAVNFCIALQGIFPSFQ